MADLKPAEYAFLILLKIHGGQAVSNRVLTERHKVSLIGEECTKLNGDGYVNSDTKRRPYVHDLTPKGKKALEEKLVVDEPDEDKTRATKTGSKSKLKQSKETQLWAALSALHEYHLTGGTPPTAPSVDGRPRTEPVTTVDGGLDRRIRAAYAKLATEPGAWVSLRRLRPLFADVSRADLDRALKRLLRAADVNLEPEPNQKTLTVADDEAAVHIDGERRHLLAIGSR